MPDAVETTLGRNLSVKDNDVFANTDLFVRQLYRDLLGREAESAGITHWSGQLAAGLDRSELVSTFVASAEFDANAGAVARLYHAVLGRSPDYCGFNYWMGERLQGRSSESIAADFLSSTEFAGSNPSLGNEAFVDLLYQNVLGRPADTAGKVYWLNQLTQGQSRAMVLDGFVQSAENKAAMTDEVAIDLLYLGLLDRAPDQPGWDYWHGQWPTLQDVQTFYARAITALEYHDRFLPEVVTLTGVPSGAQTISEL